MNYQQFLYYCKYSNYKVKDEIVYRGILGTISSEGKVGKKFFFVEFLSTSMCIEEVEVPPKDGRLLILLSLKIMILINIFKDINCISSRPNEKRSFNNSIYLFKITEMLKLWEN